MSASRRKLQFTPAVAGWLLLDVCGLTLFAAGAMFFAKGDALFVHWPASVWQAGLMVLGGGALMLVAAANLLRAAMTQGVVTPRKASSD